MRQNNFDILRFFFAFVVLLGHLVILSGVDEFADYTQYLDTYLSVTAFFVISGFLIAQSFDRRKNIKDYFKKRAARILPPYIMVLILSILLLSMFSNYGWREYFTHPDMLKYIAANFSFMNFIQPCLPGVFTTAPIDCSVNGALWTIKVEVMFYLFLPLIAFVITKFRKHWLVFVFFYLFSVGYRYGVYEMSEYLNRPSLATLSHQFPGFISYFISGIAMYYYFDFFYKHKSLLIVVGLALFFADNIVGIELFRPIGLAIIVFYIAYSFRFLNNFAKNGDISYGIYIYHCPIIMMATDIGMFDKMNPYFVALLIVVTVLALSYISWHAFEKPILNKVRNFKMKNININNANESH